MSELPNRSSGNSATTVQVSPPDIVRRRITAWGGVRAEVIEVIRRDEFEYKPRPDHLLIMSERTSRDNGETLVDGLPTSTARDFGRKLTLVPAGHQLHGWQEPGRRRVSLISTSIRTALCSAAKVVSLMWISSPGCFSSTATYGRRPPSSRRKPNGKSSGSGPTAKRSASFLCMSLRGSTAGLRAPDNSFAADLSVGRRTR